jgi:hypothetical protein
MNLATHCKPRGISILRYRWKGHGAISLGYPWRGGWGLTLAWGWNPYVHEGERVWRHYREIILVGEEELEDYGGLCTALTPILPLWRYDGPWEGALSVSELFEITGHQYANSWEWTGRTRRLIGFEFSWGFGLRRRRYQWRFSK